MEGRIKLHRKITERERYSDTNTRSLFIHLLLICNHRETKSRGKTIPFGSTIRTLETLADELSLSIQNIRTAFANIKSTGEITELKVGRTRIITIVNYLQYQSTNTVANTKSTGNQHDTNTIVTPNKNDKNNKEGKEKKFLSLEEIHTKLEGVEEKKKALLVDLFSDRITQKKPATEKAIDLILKTLDEYPINIQIQMIEKSIASGWLDVYPPKNYKKIELDNVKIGCIRFKRGSPEGKKALEDYGILKKYSESELRGFEVEYFNSLQPK